jgi:Mn2+/Fe2+ NRAMP family transporter
VSLSSTAKLAFAMRATFAYSLARFLLFAAAFGLVYLAGARGLLLFGLALVISGIISFVVLSRLRDTMSGAITSRISSFRERLDEGSQAEDKDPDSVGEPASAGPDPHP